MHEWDDVAEATATACIDYALERLRLDPVPLDHPVPYDELAARVGETISAGGRPPEAMVRLFAEVLAPACISVDSERFFSFIPGAPTKVSLLFDLVVGASSINASSWLEASGVVLAENQALRFLADAAGLPQAAGGCFVSGGSAGNLSALVVGREVAAAQREHRPERWIVAVGEQTHSSVVNTLRILDCEPLFVPSDGRDRITGSGLAAALDRCADPGAVCAVVATAGTTNAGIIDDLAGIGAVARERGLWFHVDAAYGGAALLAPSVRARFDGIETVDSFVVDPHKWLYAPFDCCALLYRRPALARAVHTQDAAYLEAIRLEDRADEAPAEWNPSDYAYHLSRRARGLPFWFSLAVHGIDAYRDAIEYTLALAHDAAAQIRALPHLDLVREPELSIVLFRRRGWTEADYLEWSTCMLDEQTAFALPTRWQGEMVGRLVFLTPRCTPELIAEVLATL
ncbi:MAG: aspartate aminotransferase family protein [Actinomycetia bacterium]|nr:aspartate aminotransferase family protein [Actinomycetes bacterium]